MVFFFHRNQLEPDEERMSDETRKKKKCQRLASIITPPILLIVLIVIVILVLILGGNDDPEFTTYPTNKTHTDNSSSVSSDDDDDGGSPKRLNLQSTRVLIPLEQFCKNSKIKIIKTPPDVECKPLDKKGRDPSEEPAFPTATDPQIRSRVELECWFSKEVFNWLFPMANQGWGPDVNRPYTYDAFVIATRYFPKFAAEYVITDPDGVKFEDPYSKEEMVKRDLASFFAVAFTKSGNHLNADPPKKVLNNLDCWLLGGLYHWFHLNKIHPSEEVEGSEYCNDEKHLCCEEKYNSPWLFPCEKGSAKILGKTVFKGCYHARGPMGIQGSDNYYYFMRWLKEQKITHEGKDIDLMKHPYLIVTKMDPPLAWISALWFYMKPLLFDKRQPVPSLHDITIGNWLTTQKEYIGSVFGPVSLIVWHNCKQTGAHMESRAFKWLCGHFGVRASRTAKEEETLVCYSMKTKKFDMEGTLKTPLKLSWDWNGNSAEMTGRCICGTSESGGAVPAYDPRYFRHYEEQNAANKDWCESIVNEQFANGGKCQNTDYKPKREK